MDQLLKFLADFVAAVLRVVAWLLMGFFAVIMLGLAVLVLTVGVLWALLRGKRPAAPDFQAQWRRYASARVWPSQAGPSAASDDQVVDVEVREVEEIVTRQAPPAPGSTKRLGD